jgi:hypothetical protein
MENWAKQKKNWVREKQKLQENIRKKAHVKSE